ncbi:MAG: DUF2490 domain-containing protein [Acidobacteria bacterium]|nr:DUF2490 domain-containing protein [Acidobacteriota bacterium]
MHKAMVWGWMAVLALPAVAAAQGSVDAQLWAQVVATVRVSEHWRLHLEEQPRWHQDMSESFQVITRAAVGRQLHERATLWGGYAWVAKPPGPGVTHEHRIWQQLSATFPVAGQWTPSLRVRLEQRFQDGWSDSSHRLRTMGRAVRPLNDSRSWSLATWNELLVTFDETGGGPWQGVDQNRLFAGLLRQLNAKTGLEFGYIWNTSKAPASERSHAHVAFVWLNLTL